MYFQITTNPTINLTPEVMNPGYMHELRDLFYKVNYNTFMAYYGIQQVYEFAFLSQKYGCVHIHALYSDIVNYGIVTTHSHAHPQSLAEELLVCSLW